MARQKQYDCTELSRANQAFCIKRDGNQVTFIRGLTEGQMNRREIWKLRQMHREKRQNVQIIQKQWEMDVSAPGVASCVVASGCMVTDSGMFLLPIFSIDWFLDE